MSSPESFACRLEIGQGGERALAHLLLEQGNCVQFAAEVPTNGGRGPQIFHPRGSLAAPDLLVFPPNSTPRFAEVKLRTNTTWHRNSGTWQTSMEERYLLQYKRVSQLSSLPVDIYIIQANSRPSGDDLSQGCPVVCPTGVFRLEVGDLTERIHHRWQRGFSQARIFWPLDAMDLVAPIESIHLGPSLDPAS